MTSYEFIMLFSGLAIGYTMAAEFYEREIRREIRREILRQSKTTNKKEETT